MSNLSQRFLEPHEAPSEACGRKVATQQEVGSRGRPVQVGEAEGDADAELAALHPDAAALGELPARAALASLIARLLAARVLREHHLWEAARILPLVAELEFDVRHWRPFRDLMAADAFTDAVRLLGQTCLPARELVKTSREYPEGFAVICDCGGRVRRSRTFRASHVDLAAAMLIALLRSFSGPRASRRRHADTDARA